jgi:hypothetical protein
MKKSFGHPHPPPAPAQVRLLDPHALRDKGINFHINHLRKLWEHNPPQFPRPMHLSLRRIAWREDVIDAWIEQRMKAPPPPKKKKKVA